jgi:hypothetical protein
MILRFPREQRRLRLAWLTAASLLKTVTPMAMLGSGYGGSYYAVTGLVYRTTKPFQKIERHWTNLIFTDAQLNSPGGTVVFNPVVDAEYDAHGCQW